MDQTEIRLKVAKEYFNRIKQEMNGGCIDAYIFGSVARDEAKESSDLDLILLLQRPTRKERFDWNTGEELKKRNFVYNFARNSHQIFIIKKELEERYGFSISVYTHYKDAGLKDVVPLHNAAFIPFEDLISNAIRMGSE